MILNNKNKIIYKSKVKLDKELELSKSRRNIKNIHKKTVLFKINPNNQDSKFNTLISKILIPKINKL